MRYCRSGGDRRGGLLADAGRRPPGRPSGGLLLLGVLLLPLRPGSVAVAGPLTPSVKESAALQSLATRIPGARLLWVRGDKVHEASAASGFATKLVTQGSIVERNPRFSPDGSQILTVRSDGVYLMKLDFSGASKVIPGGHTASWTRDGKAITAIDLGGYKVLRYELTSKALTTIYDAQQPPYNGEKIAQAAELRQGGRFLLVFRMTPGHVTEVVDLQLQQYISNQEMQRGDCSPAWAPDGSYLLTTARTTSRPVLKAAFSVGSGGGSIAPSQHFLGLDTSYKYYIHGERVASDGQHVAFGGIVFAGPLQSALREIYIWRIGDPEAAAVRVSFDTAEDESPDLLVPSFATLPKLSLSPSSLSFSVEEGSTPPPQQVAASNTGGGVLSALSTQTTYGTGSGWLKVTATGSGDSQILKSSLVTAGLAPDTYSATVKVSASGAVNSPQSFAVSLTIKPRSPFPADQPILQLSPSSLSFAAPQGTAAPPVQKVAVSNPGAGTLPALNPTVSTIDGLGWLAVTVRGSGNQQTLESAVDLDGLAPDTYGATVSVAAAGAANSPQSYAVSLTVTERRVDRGPTPDAAPALSEAGGSPPDGGESSRQILGQRLQGGCAMVAGSAGSNQLPPSSPLLLLLCLVAAPWADRGRRRSLRVQPAARSCPRRSA